MEEEGRGKERRGLEEAGVEAKWMEVASRGSRQPSQVLAADGSGHACATTPAPPVTNPQRLFEKPVLSPTDHCCTISLLTTLKSSLDAKLERVKQLVQPRKAKRRNRHYYPVRDRVIRLYLRACFSAWFSTTAVPGDIFVTMRDRKSWNVSSSNYAKNTFNPIRNIVENLQIVPHPEKRMIALSIGDPTVFGNLKPAEEITEAVVEVIQGGKCNGYAPSTGYVEAREAVAKYCSVPGNVQLEAKDILLCSGCSCALDLCITALCRPGQNILVPRPGFPLYKTLAEGISVNTKYYDLLPEKNWEVDLGMLEELIDEETSAIVVNNPSNPCGSVYSAKHLRAILDIASRNKVPIIADEIYDHFVFEGQEYHPLASLTKDVPVLSCGGLTKRYLVPGWRMGWIAIYDRNNIFDKEVRSGLHSLSQRIIGSNTLVQGALPTILSTTPKAFFADTIAQIQANAKLCFSIIKDVPGLRPIMPQGAMYMMVGVDMARFPKFSNDLQFVEHMISEESVFCLPGKCFEYPNYVRIVLTVPEAQLREACARVASFCARHYHALKDAPDGAARDCVANGSPCDARNGVGHDRNGLARAEEVGVLAKAARPDPASLVSEMEVE